MKIFICIISLLLVFSCNKESIKDPSLLMDSISVTKYYPSEIFSDINLRLYGQWQFSYIYDDAGIIMGPGKIAPTYDYLELKKYGIYGKIKNNKIIESGKIVIVKQDNSQFEINLIPDKIDNITTESWYYVNFYGNDSIKLYDASVGCGYLYNAFKKQN
jgi:hypothetical protein